MIPPSCLFVEICWAIAIGFWFPHPKVEVPLNDTLSLFVCQVPGAANRFQEMMRHLAAKKRQPCCQGCEDVEPKSWVKWLPVCACFQVDLKRSRRRIVPFWRLEMLGRIARREGKNMLGMEKVSMLLTHAFNMICWVNYGEFQKNSKWGLVKSY